MKNRLSVLVVLFALTMPVRAQYFEWAGTIGGTGGMTPEYAQDIAADSAGNSYIIGYFYGTSDFDPGPGTASLVSKGDGDVFFAKYDKDGNYVWAKSIGCVLLDAGYAIDVDISGNVYITGYFCDSADFDPGPGTVYLYSAGTRDIFIAKYNNNGNYIWAYSIGGSSADCSYGISTDDSGNVFITGSFTDSVDFDHGAGNAFLFSSTTALFLAKYDINGNYLWAFTTDPVSPGKGRDIVVDDTGNVYITGDFQGVTDFDPGPGTANVSGMGNTAVFFAKYDNNGNYVWAKSVGGSDFDEAYSIALDGSNNVCISGFFNILADFDPGTGTYYLTDVGNRDAFVAKYDNNGDFLWANNIGSNSQDDAYSIAADDSGNVYVTGAFWDTVDIDPGADTLYIVSVAYRDVFFVKYDNYGNYVWARSVGSTNDDRGRGIAVDDMQNVYITGYYQNTADFDPGPGTAILTPGGYDTFLAKYNNNYCNNVDTSVSVNGNILTANATGVNYQWIDCNNNNQPIAGETNQSFVSSGASGSYAVIIEDSICIDTSACFFVTGIPINKPGDNSIITICPNPSTGIVYLKAENIVKIEVMDIKGEHVYTGTETEIDLSGHSKGIYFIKITTDQSVVIKKILLE